ncbi:MAG: hypothetical protein WBD63_07560 [Phycisphaerae bacterium]|nr:hypothetical protein [Phycisphaerae bacterium]
MNRATIIAVALGLLAGCAGKPAARRMDWPDLPKDAAAHLACIFALDEKHAWVGGEVRHSSGPIHSVMYRTTDGGESWQRTGPAIPQSEVFSLFFLDVKHGWAAGAWTQESTSDPFVLRTSDGGATWARSDLPMPTRGTHLSCPGSIEFVTLSVGMLRAQVCIVQDEQQVFVTRDGGKTWTFSHGRHAQAGRVNSLSVNSLSVTRGGFLWKINGNRVLVSSDDGTHWQQTPAQPVTEAGSGG